MRKALIPMLASLILCGAATGALLVTEASAQGSSREPVMALVGSSALLAQNAPLAGQSQGLRSDMTAPLTRDFCQDRHAREAGRLAYMETRLALTEAQRPLFDRWKQVMLDAAQRRAADCGQRAALQGQNRADPVARMSREEATLKGRIADLDAERPVFAAFYQSLTAGQRDLLQPRSMRARDRGFVPRR
ncbi:MAG: Spy/CpxP family protein refolding chaperone [Rhizomicrobium sp.]